MDLALTLAEAGIPVSFYPMPILGATGPITIAGSAVVNNAEFVSGAALVQLALQFRAAVHDGLREARDEPRIVRRRGPVRLAPAGRE